MTTATTKTPAATQAAYTHLPKLGVDVSKKTFDVALSCDAGKKSKTRVFSNTAAGLRELQSWLVKQGATRVHAVLEATGAYGDALAQSLFDDAHVVSIVNPARIKAFGQSELQRNKTDRADAVLIARFAWRFQPEPWTPLSAEQQQLQALVRHLDDLITQRTAVSNRLTEGRLTQTVRTSWEKIQEALNAQIAAIKAEIEQLFAAHPTLQQQRELLDSIPGIGSETAARLLAEMPHLAEFESARAAAAYTGLTPRRHQSGTSLNAPSRLSKMGNARVRYALYLPAMAALRANDEFRTFKERLKKSGKKPKQIICAAMHKLVRLAYGVLKHQKAYEPNFAAGA